MSFQTKIQSHKAVIVLGLAALFILILLTVRNTGVYATIMWDEWEYNRYTRLLPLSTADVPYYLYYFVYGITKFFGSHFLTAAQFLNAVFFIASMPFIYLLCGRTSSQNWSLFIATTSILGGISVYAAHFMPEPMYFFAFWLGAWSFFKYIDTDPEAIRLGFLAGCALAILSLIKLHAVFLLPGFALYFLGSSLTGLMTGGWRSFLKATILMIIAFLIMRLALGYIIAGSSGLNIFGSTYGTRAQALPFSLQKIINLAFDAWPYLVGHIGVLIAMYTIPCLLLGSFNLHPTHLYEKRILSLQIFMAGLLFPLLIITAFYTARVSQLDPIIEGAGGLLRLHLRYYNFLFPMFGILTAAVATNTSSKGASRTKLCVVGISSVLVLLFIFNLSHIQLSVADGPELRGFATLHGITYFLVGLALLLSVIWIENTKLAAQIYLLIFMPIFTFMGAAAASYSSHREAVPNIYHQAGIFSQGYLKGDVAKMAVVGSDFAGAYQAMFYADNPDIAIYNNVPEHSCLTFFPNDDGKEWVLLIGAYQLQNTVDQNITRNGFSLIHSKPSFIESRPCPIENIPRNK